jgi:spore germination protein YaaH
MHTVLSNKILRDAQIADIVTMVNKYNFDGIEIDYENKLADDRSNFSIFLRDLYKAWAKSSSSATSSRVRR